MAKEGSESPAYDKNLIQLAIGKNNEIQLVKSIKLQLKGGDKFDTRILVITSFRVFILTQNPKGPYKIDVNIHILDIHIIESKKPEQIVIQYGEKQAKFHLTKSGSANNVIGQLIANMKINFPGGNLDESLRKDIEPRDRLEAINTAVNKLISTEALVEAGPCGGFSHSYSCICDYYGMPFLDEVAWDIDTIYLSNDTKEFNIQDFDHLETRELIPVIATLEYNAWFTKLACMSYKLPTEILDLIAKVMKRSTTMEELVLDDVSLGREFCQKLGTALISNPKSSLERIDLSNNPSVEDRGITHLISGCSKLLHGLGSLNLHDTGLTSKGASTVGQLLKNSKYMSTSLTRLNMSNNSLKVDGITVMCDFLAQANAITYLDLSSTDCSVELIFGALIRGCCQNLASLNLSRNPFSNRKSKDTSLSASFQQFFSSTAALQEISLSECHLPADAARALFLGLIENSIVKEVDVDISKNELKTAGVRAVTGPLSQISNLQSLNLSDNGFESDLVSLCESLCLNKSIKKLYIGQNCYKGRNLNNIMEALIKLISIENSPIEFLSVADSRLKQNITLLFDSLGTNESLIELDISGNMMGDEGARVLAKALQINSKLRTIHWDRNNVTQNGLRDIALALEHNLTLQSMPIPITDVTLCLKPATEKALKQIEKCLSRNHSPSQAVTEQAYRLQQGLMMTSAQQQMVDKLIVQLQDMARVLRNSPDEVVQIELLEARKCINDADKVKQLLLKFHLCTGNRSMEERISSLAIDIYYTIQQQMKENVEKILECAESNCPFVTSKEGVKKGLRISCESKSSVSKAFIDNVVAQQLAPVIFNEMSEKKLNISIIVAEAMMNTVIEQLEKHQTKLDLLLKEHQSLLDEKLANNEENDDKLSEAAQKAKNRLSAVQNRHSVRFSDDDSDVFPSPTHHKRRPTVSRKRKTSEIEDKMDGDREETTKKDIPVVIIDADLDVPIATSNELVHHTKNRPRPARGRRPPTKPSAQQSATTASEVQAEKFDAGLDDFFTKSPARPQSELVSTNVVREPAVPKSASLSQRSHFGSRKKNDKEDVEENHKEHQEKKKHGLLGSLPGIFKKKTDKDKKSPTTHRKDSKNKEHRKSLEDIIDGTPSESSNNERNSSESKPKPVEHMHPKPVPERLAKRAPEKPKKTDNPTFNDQEKTPKQEPKLPPKATKEINPAQVEKKEPTEDKLKAEEKVRESEQKTDEPTLLEAHTEDANNIKPQAKAPPKFAIGLPIGHVQGDLLAEMKKRKEKGSNKSSSPEPKPRPRLSTNPDAQRPAVPLRPSSLKRSVKSKSAADLIAHEELDSKPVPKPRSRDAKPHEENSDQSNATEATNKNEAKEVNKLAPLKPRKDKPNVASRPNVPKRPPSIVRNRLNSQKEEKEPKSSEVETPAIEEIKKETTEQLPPNDESDDHIPPEKVLSEKPPEEDISVEKISEDFVEKKGSAVGETCGEAPPLISQAVIDTNELKSEEEQMDDTKTDADDDKTKDDNDNEADLSEKSKVSTSSEDAAPLEHISADSDDKEDDVVKSSVDVETLEEAIQSSTDTEL